jgi:hypothetical protein
MKTGLLVRGTYGVLNRGERDGEKAREADCVEVMAHMVVLMHEDVLYVY